ncbi:AAA family ATPase [Vibrio sp. Isolate23]|uniref:ExeA family protein n=1 Tax=Vibrio sp. Isolate23 TaxID=2908533 RepID=UPI001EFD44F4|nr:AAA family ATPase [Vibrio sp. Isolate23]MCG9680987.1 AAA family ATPase [Vibrio sp. Isolate23]
MYLEHFGLTQFPFHLTPNTELFLGLEPHYEAIQTVQSAIEMGEGLIKITGEVGTGKTMVCRILVNQLSQTVQLVYLPNPALSGDELRRAIATELEVSITADTTLVEDIQAKLIEFARNGSQVVVFVDEAQALSDEALEVLRLFGNLETEYHKLIQIVLLGQPELDERLEQHHLRQLRQRITFSARLRTLTVSEVVAYIDNRLEKSGGEAGIFTVHQKKAIWKASRGIPRLINQICHKCLVLACSQDELTVSNQQLFNAIHDTYDSCKPKFRIPLIWGWSLS